MAIIEPSYELVPAVASSISLVNAPSIGSPTTVSVAPVAASNSSRTSSTGTLTEASITCTVIDLPAHRQPSPSHGWATTGGFRPPAPESPSHLVGPRRPQEQIRRRRGHAEGRHAAKKSRRSILPV